MQFRGVGGRIIPTEDDGTAKERRRDMRVKGFLSKVGKISIFALAFAFVTSLGVVSFPSEADAQGKRWVYAAKFKCLTIGSPVSAVGGDDFIAIQTIVNIYNPTEEAIETRKQYVIAAPQHKSDPNELPSKKTDRETVSVGAGLGHAIDCEDIVDRLVDNAKIVPTSYVAFFLAPIIEGWVIIEAPKTGLARVRPMITVCTNYQHALVNTTGGGTGISLDVECVEPKKVKPKFDKVQFN